MSRTIFCTFLKKEAIGQDFQIYPGDIGRRIYDDISQEAWLLWLNKQTMLINEKKLSMIHQEDRALLEREMIQFLFEGQDVYISGYIPPKD
ncbi:oxidative damage protection protein [Candidatus Williamhamiltonella defendens]|uniref:oxidative damage protection protein n=1 Tax=Candidatus Williamhamiltonella defendens TaxID=138072 RepID=UPI00130D60D5|nr:oxidative damage protection protein [Candidatus Hamiltonella defensa]